MLANEPRPPSSAPHSETGPGQLGGQRPAPGLAELFREVFIVGATGFGGAIVWLRRALVERRRWLTADEFNEALSLGQFLPGPNIFNVLALLGRHFHGLRGIAVMTVAIMLAPMVFAMILGALYVQYGELPAVKALMRGVAPVAAGLVLTLGLKTALSKLLRNEIAILSVLTFVAVALLRFGLPATMAVMGPLAVLVAWRRTP